MAVQKLMKAGHRHVLFLGANSHAYEQGVNFLIRTRDSVRICAEKAGMRLTCDVIDTGDADEMECVVERAFASDPRITAVLGQVGLIAMSNLKSALQSRGYDIPKDISVIQLGAFGQASVMNPPLDEIPLRPYATCARAVDVLMEIIEGKRRMSEQGTKELIAVKYLSRGSVHDVSKGV